MRGWVSILQAVRTAHRPAAILMLLAATAHGQLGQQSAPPSLPNSQTASPGNNTSGASSSGAFSPASTQDPFSGSVISEKATDQVIPLSLKEAINRGLKANLGGLLTEQGVTNARGQRWHALQAMLPDLTGRVSESAQQINLKAEGLKFPGIPASDRTFLQFRRARLSDHECGALGISGHSFFDRKFEGGAVLVSERSRTRGFLREQCLSRSADRGCECSECPGSGEYCAGPCKSSRADASGRRDREDRWAAGVR